MRLCILVTFKNVYCGRSKNPQRFLKGQPSFIIIKNNSTNGFVRDDVITKQNSDFLSLKIFNTTKVAKNFQQRDCIYFVTNNFRYNRGIV